MTYQTQKLQTHRRSFLQLTCLAVVAGRAGQSLADDRIKVLSQQLKETTMQITRLGSQVSQSGPADWFTGQSRIDPLFQPNEPARASAAKVTFEPGARTAWHTHPLGQTLIVTSGVGWVQCDDEPIHEIHPGDIVWFPPGVKHWHGASAKVAMTHIAIQEVQDGRAVDWLEHVSDEQYLPGPPQKAIAK